MTEVIIRGLKADKWSDEDALDLEYLLPVTDDAIDSARQLTSALDTLARAMHRSERSLPHEVLLELRAQLVYTLHEMAVSVVGSASHLIETASDVMSEHLRGTGRETSVPYLADLLDRLLQFCTTLVRLLQDARTNSLGPLQQLLRRTAEGNQSSSMAFSVLRTLGSFWTFAGSSLSHPVDFLSLAAGIDESLARLQLSADRIEAFWRKRQSLFDLNSGRVLFTAAHMSRFQASCQRIGRDYINYGAVLSEISSDLASSPPCVPRSPMLLTDEEKSELSWRALLGKA